MCAVATQLDKGSIQPKEVDRKQVLKAEVINNYQTIHTSIGFTVYCTFSDPLGSSELIEIHVSSTSPMGKMLPLKAFNKFMYMRVSQNEKK